MPNTIEKEAQPHIDILFRGKDTVIRITSEPVRLPYTITVHVISIFLILIKVASSLGLRIYGLVDFLTNKDYIFYDPIVSHVPEKLLMPTYVYSGLADGFMNGWTRGYSIYEMVAKQFSSQKINDDHRKIRTQDEFQQMTWRDILREKGMLKVLNVYTRKPVHHIIYIFGIFAVLSSSVTYFLGIATLMELVTTNVYAIIIPSIIAVIVNYFSQISYRIKKAIDSLNEIYNGALRRPTWWEIIVILLGSVAFLGNCDYGVSHSLRKFFALINCYHGNPDTHEGEEAFWENIIYGITNTTLVPGIFIFLLAQCCQMLKTKKVAAPASGSIIVPYEVIQSNFYKGSNAYCCPPIVIVPLLTRILIVGFNYFLIAGEMIGNGLLSFNGCTGLIFRLVTENPYAIGITALLATLVTSYIYWHFNIPDWIYGVKKVFVSAVIYSIKKISKGLTFDTLKYMLTGEESAMLGTGQMSATTPASVNTWSQFFYKKINHYRRISDSDGNDFVSKKCCC